MAEGMEHNPNELRLWRAYAPGDSAAAGSCPEAVDLASYIDGRLDVEKAAAMEAHLAACESCLETVIDMRHVASERAAGFIAPAAAAVRAKSLVPHGAAQRDVYLAALRHWLAPDWKLWGRRAAVAAAGLVLCITGYQIGSLSTPDLVVNNSDQLLLAEASFGLFSTAQGVDDTLLPLELKVHTP